MIADPIDGLIAEECLPASYRAVVDSFWQPLAERIAQEAAARKPLIVGVNGAQGSGKSTQCRFLEVLLQHRGLRTVTLSLDDLYLTKAQRTALAAQVHPLFATRGVPGTHAVDLGLEIFENLRAGRPFTLPRFDKARDDRAEDAETISGPVDVLLFEGWCVGARPQTPADLARPINTLEETEDRGGIWRSLVNRYLGGDYADLFGQIDLLVMLRVDSFDYVLANRLRQERKLAQAQPDAPGLMDEAALTRFIAHYERLTRAMLAEMPEYADITFAIGPDQVPLSLPGGLATDGLGSTQHISP